MASPECRSEPINFHFLIDSIPALIHTGLPNGDLDYFNQTWLNYAGLSLADLQGWKWTAAIHPEDVAAIVERWRACITTGKPFEHEARVRRLVIRTRTDDAGQVRVTVQDTGIDLDPQSMERMFDAFYTTKHGGMGMGLSINRSIIQNHGGKLWAVANDGPGLSVQFTIPKYQH
jgi:PAS domain-containing protein